jgi:hypothetical protein
MKYNQTIRSILLGGVAIIAAGSSNIPNAVAEGGHVGGGDTCKNEINRHRTTIRNWILKDEAKNLDFSVARIPGWTYDGPAPAKSYKRAMLAALEEGKVIITCYLDPETIQDQAAREIAKKEGVGYRAITVGNAPSTCINYEDDQGKSHIDCSYERIVAQLASGDPNYVLTHHEFASIAGVEDRTSSPSDFSISNQLSQFERWTRVKLLGTKRTDLPMCTNCEAVPPSEVKAMIDAIYDSSPGSKMADLKTPQAGVATCSSGEHVFFVPFSFGIVTKLIGTTETEIAAFANFSDYYPYRLWDNPSASKITGKFEAADAYLKTNYASFFPYGEENNPYRSRSSRETVSELKLYLKEGSSHAIDLRNAVSGGTFVFKYRVPVPAANWEASCIF